LLAQGGIRLARCPDKRRLMQPECLDIHSPLFRQRIFELPAQFVNRRADRRTRWQPPQCLLDAICRIRRCGPFRADPGQWSVESPELRQHHGERGLARSVIHIQHFCFGHRGRFCPSSHIVG